MYTIHFDGCLDGDTIGWGYIISDPEGNVVRAGNGKASPGKATNNIAEYAALIAGLEAAIELGIREIRVRGDSQLVIYQVAGKYNVNQKHLVPFHTLTMQLLEQFDTVDLEWVPRTQNGQADRICNEALRG